MNLAQINALDAQAFTAAVGFAFEHSPWIARAAWEARPFRTVEELHEAMVAVVQAAPEDRRVALIAAHPDLAGRVAREGRLTASSAGEQHSAGLDRLSPDEIARFEALNASYRARFGFPFVICAREHTKDTILEALEARSRSDRQTEISTALREIAKIARLRLAESISQ
ncbi:MAG TPA: 2-oxo-4-hydroxy-4-carboxy-5-ureidoimidazoline decarboxylase [Candidatus Baltobacteraceae bacterium]|nr:2-oxo-4-hydroxy-4-carboxy-5-ureidoimidazoline decarboxylase [Candidatus Baltobacteraceae bacterium]